jgi:formylglycine-generating enzyme required for sulfatase activity
MNPNSARRGYPSFREGRFALVSDLGGSCRLESTVIQFALGKVDANLTRSVAELRRELNDKVVTNSIGMKFVSIPAGNFMMGSPENETGR